MGIDTKKHDMGKKRVNRRKRRIRSQIIAYFFLILIVGVLGFGIYKGVIAFAAVLKEQGQPIDEVISQDAVTDMENEGNTEDAGVIGTPSFETSDEIMNSEGNEKDESALTENTEGENQEGENTADENATDENAENGEAATE